MVKSNWSLAAVRLTLLCTLVFCARVSAAASDIVPVIPSPPDFVEVSELFPEARKLALIGHPTSEKLIGIYYPKDSLDKIASQGLTTPTPFARAYLESVLPTTSAAKRYFSTLCENAKKETSNATGTPSSDSMRIIDNYSNAVSQSTHSNSKLRAEIVKRELIIDENQPDWFGENLSINFTLSDGSDTKRIQFATTVIWLRIATQVIQFSVVYPSEDMDARYRAPEDALNWLGSIGRTILPITHSDDNFVELDEDTWSDVIDLRTLSIVIPGKVLVTTTSIAPPDIIKQKLTALDILSKFCDKTAGLYAAPTELLTLGPPDFRIDSINIEVNENRTEKIISWDFPYKRLLIGSSKAESLFICYTDNTKATQDGYNKLRADITNGTKSREMLDCNRGLFNTLPSGFSNVDDLLVSQPAYPIGGAFKHHYLAVCRKIGIPEPYLPQ